MSSLILGLVTKLVRRSPSSAAPSAASVSTRNSCTSRASTQPSTDSGSERSSPSSHASNAASEDSSHTQTTKEEPRKSQAELDKELQAKMEGISGDGGGAGVTYEDGQPVAMKRSVKKNMFRLI